MAKIVPLLKEAKPEDQLLTMDAVAAALSVDRRVVLRLVQTRKIRGVRVGRQWRFRQSWLDAFIEGRRW